MIDSIKVENVEKAFDNLPVDGSYFEYVHLPYYGEILVNHIQGFTKFSMNGQMCSIFTHSAPSKGWLFCKYGPKSGDYLEFETPKNLPLNHPGGIQALGQYVFVPCEDKPKSWLLIYHMTDSAKACEKPKFNAELIRTISFDHAASSCGVTTFEDNEHKKWCLLVMNENPECHFYLAECTNAESPADLIFVKVGECNLRNYVTHDEGFESIGLITDVNNNVYMIAPFCDDEVSTYGDHANLFKLTIDMKNVSDNKVKETFLATKHFTSHQGVSGYAGIHFRWGAGVYVNDQHKLCICATSRNVISAWYNRLDTNTWEEK